MATNYSDDATKTKMASRVLVAAQRDRQRFPREEDAAWLNRSAARSRFDPCRVLGQPEIAETLLDDLLERRPIYRRDKWVEALGTLLANLLEAWRARPKHPIRMSRDANDWHAPDRYAHPCYQTIELMDLLHERGYIEMKKGHHYEDDSKQTRIWALPELLRTHQELLCANVTIRPPYEPVELYERKEGRRGKRKLIDYRDTEFTCRTRKILQTANEVNGRATIEYDDGFEIQQVLSYVKAMFIGKFTLYGRLHSYGCRHVQGLSKHDRETITIDGCSVIERDFSALHPHLLYAAEGLQYAGDPYTAVVRELLGPKADAKGWSQRGRSLRSFCKTALLAALNSNDFRHAEQAVNYWLYEHHDEHRDLSVLGITRARPVLEAFMAVHAVIAHHFWSGKLNGLRTMNKDARIALDVLWHFVQQRIPIIPIHDSFLVPTQYDDELRRTMDETYRKHTGGFSCPIK